MLLMALLSLDSADFSEIEYCIERVLDNVITTPSLLRKAIESRRKKGENTDFQSYITSLCELLGSERKICLDIVGRTADEIIKEGRNLFNYFNFVAENVWINIPICTAFNSSEQMFEGMKAIRVLSNEEIPVNATLIMKPEHAVIASYLGAVAVTAPVGRVDDYLFSKAGIRKERQEYFPARGIKINDKKIKDNGIASGIDLLAVIKNFFRKNKMNCTVIASSLRNPRKALEAENYCDIATMPFEVYKEYLPIRGGSNSIPIFYHQDIEERLNSIARNPFETAELEKILAHPKTFEGADSFYKAAREIKEYNRLIYAK